MKAAIESIRSSFKDSNSAIILKGVQLLETCVKNCNEKFHYEVGNKKFQETVLKLLRYKRGKANIF